MAPEYRCSECDTLLDVEPDVMRTDAFVVKPCEKCTTCEGCLYEED